MERHELGRYFVLHVNTHWAAAPSPSPTHSAEGGAQTTTVKGSRVLFLDEQYHFSQTIFFNTVFESYGRFFNLSRKSPSCCIFHQKSRVLQMEVSSEISIYGEDHPWEFPYTSPKVHHCFALLSVRRNSYKPSARRLRGFLLRDWARPLLV